MANCNRRQSPYTLRCKITYLVFLCIVEEFADVIAGQDASLLRDQGHRATSVAGTHRDDIEDAHGDFARMVVKARDKIWIVSRRFLHL
jgi:hypothetical protein